MLRLLYPFKNSTWQTFLQDFADAVIKVGIQSINPMKISRSTRGRVGKLRVSRNFSFLSKGKYLIVLCGGFPDYAAFPYAYVNRIIPVIWDSWPIYWDKIINSFKRHNVRIAFFTQRQVANMLAEKLPGVQCIYLPEALTPNGYLSGSILSKRSIDVLELGRLHAPVHNELESLSGSMSINHLYANDVTQKRLFDTFDELAYGLSESKIVINYPRCVTHPEVAGQVETLTQRYWECMYSRSILVGHAPQELIDLVGYNPVIEADVKNIKEIVVEILNNIDNYQELVDRNYETAKRLGSWDSRMDFFLENLKQFM